jgi:cellulose synthase/poly-beta-1,6-N-acetylglucosamine synthase-like glycosyltransferase
MKILFWLSLFWVFYAYAGYLLLLMLINKVKKEPIEFDEEFVPSISLIIAAYNEEKVIGRKIEESLALDYPKDKLEIIVASDASTDGTDAIVKSFVHKGVILVRQAERKGKTSAQNLAFSKSTGEVLVFSDATTLLEKDVLRKLSRYFIDFRVGCVGGEERFIESKDEISEEAGFFWKYETLIRRAESDFNTMIGVSGCVFALRKDLYEPLDEALIEDFVLPLKVAAKGYKVVYEKDAIGYERAAPDTGSELKRKTRIVSGGISVVLNMRRLLNPLRHPLLAFQIFSHKICRWLAPVFMVLLFISNMFLLPFGIFYLVLGILQALFYLTALAGYFARNYRRLPRVPRLAYHFCVVNSAAVLGMAQFLRGEKKAIWNPVR